MDSHFSELFVTKRLKLLSRPDVLKFYGEMGVDIFCTSELLYPDVGIIQPLIKARPNFCLITNKTKVNLGIVDSLLFTIDLLLPKMTR